MESCAHALSGGDGFGKKYSYTEAELLRTLFLSQLSTDAKSLPRVIEHAISLVLPALGSYFRTLLARKPKYFIPDKGTVSRARVLIDAALTLVDHRSDTEMIRYGMADSSPQGQHDWLLSCFDEIKVEAVTPVFRAVHELVKESKIREAEGGIDQEQSVRNHRTLHEGFRRTNSLPQALASGATSLTHKVGRLVYGWSLGRRAENFMDSTLKFTLSFFGYCTDMGTELGISQFNVSDVSTPLPPWFRRKPLTSDVWVASTTLTWMLR